MFIQACSKVALILPRFYSVSDRLMSMEHLWNDTHRRETKVAGDQPLPLPVYPPQISKE